MGIGDKKAYGELMLSGGVRKLHGSLALYRSPESPAITARNHRFAAYLTPAGSTTVSSIDHLYPGQIGLWRRVCFDQQRVAKVLYFHYYGKKIKTYALSL